MNVPPCRRVRGVAVVPPVQALVTQPSLLAGTMTAMHLLLQARRQQHLEEEYKAVHITCLLTLTGAITAFYTQASHWPVHGTLLSSSLLSLFPAYKWFLLR